MRFIEWDFGRHVSTEYERLGECNRCGECCRAEIHFWVRREAPLKDDAAFWREGADHPDDEGTWCQVVTDEGRARFFRMSKVIVGECAHACSVLTPEGLCAVQAAKNFLCASWPMAPAQVDPFPHCSYSFLPIKTERFLGFPFVRPSAENVDSEQAGVL